MDLPSSLTRYTARYPLRSMHSQCSFQTDASLESANSILKIAELTGLTVMRIGRRCENISPQAMMTSLVPFSSFASVLGKLSQANCSISLTHPTELYFALPNRFSICDMDRVLHRPSNRRHRASVLALFRRSHLL